MDDFSALLNSYDYRWDFLRGIADNSPQEPDFFFGERGANRDCDAWARMWLWWAQEQGYSAWEVAIANGITRLHMITVIERGDKYTLCDYWPRGDFNSMEDVKNYYRKGRYPNLVWVLNKGV